MPESGHLSWRFLLMVRLRRVSSPEKVLFSRLPSSRLASITMVPMSRPLKASSGKLRSPVALNTRVFNTAGMEMDWISGIYFLLANNLKALVWRSFYLIKVVSFILACEIFRLADESCVLVLKVAVFIDCSVYRFI